MKHIIIFVGPKGSGKSTICSLLEKEMGMKFIRVEPLFLQTRAELGASNPDFERIGYQKVLAHLAEELSRCDMLCFESTGASGELHWLLAELHKLATVLPVQIQADSLQCVERVKSRDTSIHIPVSDDQVERINKLAVKVELPWVARIDNRYTFDRNIILETIRGILGQ
jgi:cytidylate kinase